jgi:hypothetical protein
VRFSDRGQYRRFIHSDFQGMELCGRSIAEPS